MSEHNLKGLTLRLLFSLLALTLLIFVVWWIGPAIQVGHFKPFDQGSEQLLTSVILAIALLAYPSYRLFTHLRASRHLKQGLSSLKGKLFKEDSDIAEVFRRAVSTLNSSASKGFWRFSRNNLYELPWYVVVGAPGSGKSTLIRQSGLRFPLQQSLGSDVIRSQSGTRSCDWWFSDKAVLLDTAGRLTTQDSDSQADASGWLTLLRLLKNYRPRCPINAALVCVSAQELVHPESQVSERVQQIRQRLQEMSRALGSCPPIYLLITKLDQLTGFVEAFGHLDQLSREGGLGVVLESNQDKSDPTILPIKLNNLSNWVDQQTLDLLEINGSLEARRLLIHFPPLFARLTQSLNQWIELLHQYDRRFEKPLQFCGVHFTSAVQETGLIERMTQSAPTMESGQIQSAWCKHLYPSERRNRVSQAYFIQGALNKSIFSLTDSLNISPRLRRIQTLRSVFTIVSVTLATLIAAGAIYRAYSNEQTKLAQITAQLEQVQPEIEALNAQVPSNDTVRLLSVLRILALLEHMKSSLSDSVLFSKSLGAQDLLNEQLIRLDNQFRAKSLEPEIHRYLERKLEVALERKPSEILGALNRYLTWLNKDGSSTVKDHQSLAEFIATEWRTFYQNENNGSDSDSVTPTVKSDYFQALLTSPHQHSLKENTLLIERARTEIARVSPAVRVYQQLLLELGQQTNQTALIDFDVRSHLGLQLSLLVQEASKGTGNTDTQFLKVNRVFTSPVLITEVLPKLPALVERAHQQYAKIDTNGQAGRGALIDEVRALYIADYIAQWRQLLSQIRPPAVQSLDQAKELARNLSNSDSAFIMLLKSVTKHTAPPGEIARQFKDFNQTMQAESLNSMAQTFVRLHQLLNEISFNQGQSTTLNTQDLSTLFSSASFMAEPFRSYALELIKVLHRESDRSRRKDLASKAGGAINLCQRAVTGHYPFEAKGVDMPLADFNRLFSPDGDLNQLFHTELANLTDRSGPRWVARNSSVSAQAVTQFQRAHVISQSLFPIGQREASFTISLRSLPSNSSNQVLHLETDQQTLTWNVGGGGTFAQTQHITWSSKNPSTRLMLRNNKGHARTWSGPWALFRMFDDAKPQSIKGRSGALLLEWGLGSDQYQFEMSSDSVLNPLALPELRLFRCPSLS